MGHSLETDTASVRIVCRIYAGRFGQQSIRRAKSVAFLSDSGKPDGKMELASDSTCNVVAGCGIASPVKSPVARNSNHRIEEVIKAGNGGDFTPFHHFHQVLQHLFNEQPKFTEYESTPASDEVVQETFCGT